MDFLIPLFCAPTQGGSAGRPERRKMRVYCDVLECINCKEGECTNRFDTGEEAISLHENIFGRLICTDYKAEAEEEDE